MKGGKRKQGSYLIFVSVVLSEKQWEREKKGGGEIKR